MLQLLIACQWTFALSAYEIKRSMPRSYVHRNGLPSRQDEAYGRMYYEHVTKSNRQSSRETPTVETSVSTLRCRAVEKKLSYGFDQCIEARTCVEKQQALDGSFFKWNGTVNLSDKNPNGTQLRTDVNLSEFELELNTAFSPSVIPEEYMWIPWLTVKPSTLAGTGYGLFANHRFESNDTIGVDMRISSIPIKLSRRSKHKDKPYAVPNAIENHGGVDSGARVNLGMHFIQAPDVSNCSDDDSVRPNVHVNTDGRVVALKRIYKHEELFINCNSK